MAFDSGYNAQRSKNIFQPGADEVFTLSRSKIDLYFDCPRCFYLDRRLGVNRPPMIPLSLNNAVDELLKKEFDTHRKAGTPHPLLEHYGVRATPFHHEDLEKWRDSLRAGVQYLHEPTQFLIRGGIDDVWQDEEGKLIVADYKATSKKGEITIDAPWQDAYKRQLEIYQWLFRQNGFDVSDTGYFVYANGRADREAFDGTIEFDVHLIPYTGSTDWIEPALHDMREVLESDEIPEAHPNCDYCKYRDAAGNAFRRHVKERKNGQE